MKVSEKTIDDLDKKILHGIRHGLRFKEVAQQVGKTETVVKKRMLAMRVYYQCGNNAQLIVHLIDNGLL